MREHFILSVLMLTMSRSRDDVNVLSEPPKLLCSCNLTAYAVLKLLAVESYRSNENFFNGSNMDDFRNNAYSAGIRLLCQHGIPETNLKTDEFLQNYKMHLLIKLVFLRPLKTEW